MSLLLIIRISISLIPHIGYPITRSKFNYIYVDNVNCRRRFVPEKEAEDDKFWLGMFEEEGSGMDVYTTVIGLVLTNAFTAIYC